MKNPFRKPQPSTPTARKSLVNSGKPGAKAERNGTKSDSRSSPRERDKAPVPSAGADTKGAVEQERIQKILARGGLGSRREIEGWISEGRVKINGTTAKLGDRLAPGDLLYLNGRPVIWEKFSLQPTRVLVYHKPVGEIVSRKDPQGRTSVFNRMPKLLVGRWISVGRLDINTSGLLLLTNNGELANRLMHPSTVIEREYAVRILGEVSDEVLAQLKTGIELEDGPAKFNHVHFYGGDGANKWYHVTVSEGRNRLVRRLWEAVGVTVSRLMRVRYGPAALPEGLRVQGVYEMTPKELDMLLEFVGLPKQAYSAP